MRILNTLIAIAGGLSTVAITGCERPTTLSVSSISNPSPAESRLPNLTRQGDEVILSWVTTNKASLTATPGQPASDTPAELTHSLEMSKYSASTGWSQPSTIAEGAHWFVNWADFPSVYAVDDNRLAAHWLKRSGKSTYAYDVVTSQSIDGVHWSASKVPHLDGTQTEHGFASFFKLDDQASLVWLDGRNTKPSGDGHSDHSGADTASAMSLRTRVLSPSASGSNATDDTTLSEVDTVTGFSTMSTLLDNRVCDCCQTTAVNTDLGAIVFYRDRSADEIRDIAFVRYDQNSQTWSAPEHVYNDGWKITGCPVNGPQAVANGRFVAITWFTAAPTPRVQIAVSSDSGATFSSPVIISDSEPLGRVAVALLKGNKVHEGNQFLVSWLEGSGANSASLNTALFDAKPDLIAQTEVAQISAARRSGFPRMAALSESAVMITWTDWVNKQSSVHTAQIDIR